MSHASLQLLGYAASLLIATSLLMRSIVRLRAINLAGALTFSVYGFLIGAYPVALLNLMTATINIVQLIRLRRRRELFRVIEISPDSPYLRYVFEVQARDIAQFFPHFRYERAENTIVLLVLRDLVPAGILVGTAEGDTLTVQLDYVLPQYRDLKVGRFLFSDSIAFFRDRGFREIVATPETRVHTEYVERMGFRRGDGGYRLQT